MKPFKTFTIVCVLATALSGCVSYVEMPDIALIEKAFPKPEEVSELSFALTQPEIIIKTNISNTLTTGLFDRAKYDAEKVNCYLTGELEKILISKGFTITDVFESHNNMTFTEKRNTSAIFYPEITIEIEEKGQTVNSSFLFFDSYTNKSRLKIDASIKIVMKEPLSNEKLWIKSLPVTDVDQNISYTPAIYGGIELNGSFVPKPLGSIAGIIDGLVEKIAAEVVNSTEKYVEREEFEFLNTDIEKLKKIKRY